MMSKLMRMAAIFLILVVAAVGAVSAASDSTDNDKVIHSTGTGNVIGTPDRAQVTFSVQTENTDVKQAQAENSAKMNTVIEALIASGIPATLSRPPATTSTRYTRNRRATSRRR